MNKRLFWLIFITLLVFHASLIGSRRLLPYTDLPNHLAIATAVRHADQSPLAEAVVVDLRGKANSYFWNFCRLSCFTDVSAAARWYYILYALLLPLSVLAAIRRLGGNRWLAIGGFLLLYNFNVTWGFVGFTLAVPLVLLFFVVTAEEERLRPSRLTVAAALLVWLFYVHVIALLFALGYFALATLLRDPRRPRAWLGPALAVVPAGLLLAFWWLGQPTAPGPSMGQSLADYYTGPFWRTAEKRLGFLVFDNYRLFPRPAGYIVAALFALGIVAPAAVGMFRVRRRLVAALGAPLTAFLGFAAFCFFLLPAYMPGHWAIFQRFSVFLLLALLLAAARCFASRAPRSLVAVLVVLAAAHAALWAHYHVAFDRENADFGPEFFPAADAGRLAGFITDARYRGRPVYNHFPSYFTVWRRGLALSRVVDYRFGAVRRRGDAKLLPAYVDFLEELNYDGRYTDIEWLLVRGVPPPNAGMDRYEPVREAGAFKLYRRREGVGP
ncbi:MAG: hypothetical protein P9L99_04560 [Candidatus Lernaella stagnicola]|nr:hypothetical protein [Candidatus Lernaella stagnicola]